MSAYQVGGQVLPDTGDDAFQFALADHYHNRKTEPPRCLCRDPSIPLYIARVGDRYHLKRWPNTGGQHHYTCDKYEPPMETSGIGSLMGGAIKEEPLTGMTTLTVDFALKKVARGDMAPKASVPEDEAADDKKSSASSDTRKLTLKSILHYLWDRSGFCRWTPTMEGKRNWAVISAYLNETAQTVQVKRQPLSQLLYIPPSWNQTDSERQKARRQSVFAGFQTRSGPRRLVMVLGEVKTIEPSQFGYRLTLKHMGETRVYLSDRKLAEINQRFGFELASWRQHGDPEDNGKPHHLMALLTATVTETGVLQIEDLTLMILTPQWLPYFSLHDGLVVSTAVALKRKFLKPMTYNLGKGRTLPSIILIDTQPIQVNLFVKTPVDSDTLNRSREGLIEQSRGRSVIWDTSDVVSVFDWIEGLQQTRLLGADV
ncbi:DUF1173 family protein [Asticcacaulis sp. W401b]|uniref:DUF1173 family protein n=1 Tax=Asticcacaulis sp. W401b TaxID=3388666 RepID=UPI003970EBB0